MAARDRRFRSVVSIVVTGDNALVYYDHWEDGYELDIANPTQSTSLIFGDGNTANGDAEVYCGVSCAGDVLSSGAVLSLESNVPLPRNPANTFFDGRDKIGATKNAVVARAAWPTSPGTVMADSVEAPEVRRWGLAFEIPMGEDLSSDAMFEYTGLMVMASENGTQVRIDQDNDGAVDITQILNEGEVHFVDGDVNVGASVIADKTGDCERVDRRCGRALRDALVHDLSYGTVEQQHVQSVLDNQLKCPGARVSL